MNPPPSFAVVTEGLGFTYRGAQRPALRDVSFTVESGEIVGLLGPSGAGKSTLQRVLTGLLAGASGRAHILGREISQWGRELYARIGVSFENPSAVGRLSLKENLAYIARMYSGPTRDPEELLEAVGLAEDAACRAKAMSKGMGVRLNVARALLHRPDLLFLDEPSAGLDPVGVSRMKDLIASERARGCTVVLTTHDMVLAQSVCDRVGFIVDGRLALMAPPDELRWCHGRREVVVTWEEGRRAFPLDGLADNADFHRILRECEVRTLHSQEADLAEVFRAVTGRSLR